MAKKSSTIQVRILGDNKGLSSSLDDSESKIGKFAGNAGKIAAGAAIAVGGAVVAGLAKGFSDALGAQDNTAMIGAQLGISPQDAAEIGQAASGAYRDAWGSSLAEVSNTAVAISQGFTNLTDGALEGLTGNAQALARTFGVDVTAAVQTASEMVSGGLAGSAEEAFDLLTAGLQEMPVAIRGELLEASNEYGTFFSALGLNGSEAFGILTEGAENGIYGIDKAGDAIKEFTIRSTDMSTASKDAYQAIGLDSWEMANQILAGGDTAKGAFDDIVGGLLAMEDPAAQAQAAIALFGTPLEDIGVNEIPDFLAALKTGAGGMGDFEGAAQDMADTVGGTTSSKLEAFKRRALGGLADFAANNLLPPFESFLGWSEKNWPKIQGFAEDAFESVKDAWEQFGEPVFDTIVDVGGDVVDFFESSWPKVQDAVTETFNWVRDNKDVVIGALVALGIAAATILVPAFIAWAGAAAAAAAATLVAAAPFIAIGVAIAAIGAAAVWAYQNVGWFREAVDTVVSFFTDTVWPIMQQTYDVIVSIVSGIVEWIRTNWDTIEAITLNVFDAIWGYLETIWNTIYGVVDGYITAVKGVINTVLALIRGDWEGVWNGIKQFLTGVWDVIKSIVSGAVGVVQGYVSTGLTVISTGWGLVWGGIKDTVGDVWEGIETFVSDGIDAVVGFITGLPGRVASGLGSGFNALWENFKGVINKIIDAINSIKLPSATIGGFDTPFGKAPSFTTPAVDPFPHVTRLALGGLAYAPTLAVVGDNPGARTDPEVIAPLSKLVDLLDRRDAMSSGGPITLVIEGRPFTAMLAEHDRAVVGALMAGAR